MDRIGSQVIPVPPNMIASLREGFDAVANQIVVIIIPIVIDLILWLGPHFQVKTLVNGILKAMASSTELNSLQSGDLLTTSMDVIRTAAEHFNLLSLLRTIPVGIPSLMAARLPLDIPNGTPNYLDINNLFVVSAIGIGLLLVGLIIGCFYYILIVQVALQGRIEFKLILKNWSWASLQVLSLTLALLILFILISVPSSCAISAIALFGLPLGQFAIFLYIGIMLWLAFPLLFSAHGIFVNHNNALASVQRSMLLTRVTLPTTSLFILSILVISEGLDVLWRIPPETSWLTLIGVGGHAFITSALLAASFVYFRDADRWAQETLRMINSPKEVPLQGR
ncbi:MAG: hypothetical protein A2Y53_02755 [Chloroflexi bacterium RBG_16_47_49]|nr:MAG: hypothetical protein A2Y53_02755 [Chloroflexi bacterium RBG_16_47_49]